MPNPVFRPCLRSAVELLEDRTVPTVTVRLDYSYDVNGFFNDPVRREVMERAAQAVSSKIFDDLSAINPSGVNTWRANFFNPITNSTVVLTNPVIRDNEILVFVGGSPLGDGDELGLTTTGGFSATGSRSWLDNVRSRGQVGTLTNPKTDYSTWGGMITFDSGVNWSFSSGNPAVNQYDFESVALHEMMHIFGFGLGEPAFTRNVSGGKFIGPTVVYVNGGVAPSVVGDPPDHWAPGTSFGGQPSPLQASLPQGEKRTLTTLDYAVLNDIGWEIYTVPGVSPPTGTLQPTQVNVVESGATTSSNAIGVSPASTVNTAPVSTVAGRFAVGSSGGITAFGPTGQVLMTAFPFGGGYTAGIRVASGDINGDGIPDIIAGTGPGSQAIVRIVDGATAGILASITPFENSFTGGVNVAAGDFNFDGRVDVVISADASGGPVVAIYDGLGLTQGRTTELTRFLAIDDPAFRGGVRVAAGDINGDKFADLVVAAGVGGGPRIATYDGRSLRGTPISLFPDFFAYEASLRNGTYVAVADLDSDGRGDVVVGAGPGGAPRVTAFSGAKLLINQQIAISNFFSGGLDARGGVRVASVDLNNDGQADVITGSGEGSSQVLAYQRGELLKGTPASTLVLTANGNASTGVFVG